MAKSIWGRGAEMAPYLDVLLTCYSAYTFLLTILENLSDPARKLKSTPTFIDLLQITDLDAKLMIPVFFMISVTLVLFIVQLYAALNFLRVATKMDPNRDVSQQLKLCKIWIAICGTLMVTEQVGYFLFGKYTPFCYNYRLIGRVFLIYVVHKFMEELKVSRQQS